MYTYVISRTYTKTHITKACFHRHLSYLTLICDISLYESKSLFNHLLLRITKVYETKFKSILIIFKYFKQIIQLILLTINLERKVQAFFKIAHLIYTLWVQHVQKRIDTHNKHSTYQRKEECGCSCLVNEKGVHFL